MNDTSNLGKLIDSRQQRAFFILCWTAYFMTYIGRLNFSASLAEISNSAGFSKSALGMVSSGFFISYGVFQLVWGLAGDKLNPARMIFFGIFFSGFINLGMAFCTSTVLMTVLWSLNGIAQSSIWSPLLRLTVDRLPGNQAMRCSIRYSTSVPMGTFGAYGLAAICTAFGSWRAVFVSAAVILLGFSMIWLRGMAVLAPASSLAKSASKQTDNTPAPAAAQNAALPKGLFLVLIPVAIAALAHGMIRDGIQTWMPTYLTETHGLDGVSSIAFTLVLPLVNLCGVYIGKFLNEKLFHNEVSTSAISFVIAALLLIPTALGMQLPLWLALALFGLCAAMMLSINTMLVTLVPMQLKHTGRVSALSGLLNSVTYVGSALSGYGVGLILERFGWATTLWSWFAFSLVAAALCCIVIHAWKKMRTTD